MRVNDHKINDDGRVKCTCNAGYRMDQETYVITYKFVIR